jgi:hypothetical protein
MNITPTLQGLLYSLLDSVPRNSSQVSSLSGALASFVSAIAAESGVSPALIAPTVTMGVISVAAPIDTNAPPANISVLPLALGLAFGVFAGCIVLAVLAFIVLRSRRAKRQPVPRLTSDSDAPLPPSVSVGQPLPGTTIFGSNPMHAQNGARGAGGSAAGTKPLPSAGVAAGVNPAFAHASSRYMHAGRSVRATVLVPGRASARRAEAVQAATGTGIVTAPGATRTVQHAEVEGTDAACSTFLGNPLHPLTAASSMSTYN